jgi:hypothetical protein
MPSQGSEIFAPKTEAFYLSQCGQVLTDLNGTCEKFRSARLGAEASLRGASRDPRAQPGPNMTEYDVEGWTAPDLIASSRARGYRNPALIRLMPASLTPLPDTG